jgi:hypothetical protein
VVLLWGEICARPYRSCVVFHHAVLTEHNDYIFERCVVATTLAFTVEKAQHVLHDWPNCFYTPPEFPSVPGFDSLDLDIAQPKPGVVQARLPGRVGCMIAPWRRELYVFHGDRYKLLNVSGATNSVYQDVRPITQSELSYLGHSQVFASTGVDAVFPNPLRNSDDTHFFCGETYLSAPPPGGQYLMSNLLPLSKRADAYCFWVGINPPRGPVRIVDVWACLREANFTTIDAVLEIPGASNYAWFFSGTQYIGAEWKTSGSFVYI